MDETTPQPPRRRAAERLESSWSQVWQLPLLMLGVGLFMLGVWLSIPDHEPFDFASELDEAGEYLAARNTEAAEQQLRRVEAHFADADAAARGRFWQYWGDLRFEQRERVYDRPVDTPGWRESNQAVVNAYTRAEEAGRTLDGQALRRWADALVVLGRQGDALELVDRIDEGHARQRYMIVRELIERQRQGGASADAAQLEPLLARFEREIRLETDRAAHRAQEIWITRVRAEARLEVGDAAGTIEFLVTRRLPRLTDASGDQADLAPLWVLLAQAYQQAGEFQKAEQHFQLAQGKLEDHDALQAEVLVGLGQVQLQNPAGDTRDTGQMHVEQAMGLFGAAAERFPSEPAYVDALIGRADCEARLGMYREAVEHFGLAVRQLVANGRARDPRRAEMVRVVRSHIERLNEQAQYELTLDFLSLLSPLHTRELPAELLLDFAATHERVAEQRLDEAGERDGEANPPRELARDARRVLNQEAATHYAQAAMYYLRHAREVTITDDFAHGQSLWQAARSFDRAQQWPEAIDTYAEFIHTRQQDPLRLRAINHLGQAYLADGQAEPAIDLFLELINDHPRSPEAYDSLVPLARANIAVGQEDAAERTLLTVVTDHEAISPETTEYRNALIELGRLYYRMGEDDGDRFVDAIEKLEEAVERYGQSEQSPTLRFVLADAYRKSVRQLEEEIDSRQAQRERVELQAERTRRLREAQKFYNQVITELEARAEGALTAREGLYLRNAYFYQGDCAYDRGQFELAISLYDAAARRWEDHPASLMALVQIVNAHCELEQFQEARVANQRARAQLDRLPEDAFDDPTLPMTQRHWEDWLRWTHEVNLSQAAR